jgi:RNA polymerase sigma factor (TIGR02999 family)
MTDPADNITQLLRDVDRGRDGAMDDLMAAVYGDLQAVAEKHMRERFGHGLPGVTLEPAALVNESFLRLIKQRTKYDNRGHFFAIATKVMLRVLVDYQRRRIAAKRGGGVHRVTLALDVPADAPASSSPGTQTLIGVDSLVESLEKLEALDARKADVVKLRVVWGLQMKEIAESLGISLATVERDWAFSKAWLAREAAAEDQAGAESPTRG